MANCRQILEWILCQNFFIENQAWDFCDLHKNSILFVQSRVLQKLYVARFSRISLQNCIVPFESEEGIQNSKNFLSLIFEWFRNSSFNSLNEDRHFLSIFITDLRQQLQILIAKRKSVLITSLLLSCLCIKWLKIFLDFCISTYCLSFCEYLYSILTLQKADRIKIDVTKQYTHIIEINKSESNLIPFKYKILA